jgi:xanthine dehydrogenase accessory factor
MYEARRKDINDLAHEMKSRGDAFAMATVVRTVSVTAAKPGAKAIIDGQGNIVDGWIGGGCARQAVLKAARQSIDDGQTRLVSIQPQELLHDQLDPSDTQVINAKNMCPSQGSMDIFVEPVLAHPVLLVIGNSPVAIALAEIGGLFDLQVEQHQLEKQSQSTDQLAVDNPAENAVSADHPHRYIIIATQGSSDLKALVLALSLESRHVGFVGSRRKIQHLQGKLQERGLDSELVERVHSPAGLDIKAVTPQEIALSIVAEIVRLRRS